MSAAKHTPGPWHWHKSRTLLHLHDAKGNCFSQVSMPSPHNQDQQFAPLYEANAQLIVAAPDLAESAAGFLNWFQGFVGAAGYAEINCKELTALQAALAKVTS